MSIRVMFDVNVLLSAVFNDRGTPAHCIERANDTGFVRIISEEVLRTYEGRLHTRSGLSGDAIALAVAVVRMQSHVVQVSKPVACVTSDPEDDVVLATAVAGRATYLVTGDKRHLLPLGEHRGVRIVTPRVFLDECERAQA